MRVLSYRAALTSVVIAGLLSLLFHPRVFFGSGSGGFVSFDDLFFAGQWSAAVVALLGLVCGVVAWKNGQPLSRVGVVFAIDVAIIVLLLVKGVPHKANRTEWRSGALGIAQFMRGAAKQRAENAPPAKSSADRFAGTWRDVDGATYAFGSDRITKRGSSQVDYSGQGCGSSFSLEYFEQGRDALLDLGLTWSVHAGTVHDATAADARIHSARVTCGEDIVLFLRATPNEVWRLTSALSLEAIKGGAFVLARVDVPPTP